MPIDKPIPEPVRTAPGAPQIWLLWLIALSGVLLALSFPNELLPGAWRDHPPALLGWVALIPLLWGVLFLPPRYARRATWAYGLLFALCTVSWMRLFTVLPWMLLALYLSLTPLLAVWLTQMMRLPRWLMPLGFALLWTGGEWLRGQGIFGFAWSEIGMSQIDGLAGRLAALGGTHLITFLMLWTTGSILVAISDPETPRWLAPVAAWVLAIALVGGFLQSAQAVTRWPVNGSSTAMTVSVIQPNTLRGLTPEALVTDLSPEELQRRVNVTLDLTRQSAQTVTPFTPGLLQTRPTPHLVVWPESSLTIPPYCYPQIMQTLYTTGSHLLAGAPLWVTRPDGPHIQNAAYLLTPSGNIDATYQKVHLVPFGEFVPLRALVVNMLHFTVRDTDIIPGAGHLPLSLGPHRFGVGICFESSMPEISREYANRGARMLIFITNDAWFHETSAVCQHLNQARFRALETGLPVARAANTGISAFIAPDGQVLEEIPVYTTGYRTRAFPDSTPGTLYTYFGWLTGPLCLGCGLILVIMGIIRHRRNGYVV